MAVTVSLESPDPIDIARVAIERVAGIAVQVGVQYKRPICGLLAAQLLLTTYDLDDSGFDEEKRLRLRLLKLLKDVQLICSWPTQTSEHSYPLLEAIAQTQGSTQYSNVESEIRQGLVNFSLITDLEARNAIRHIGRFRERGDTNRGEADQDKRTRRNSPASYPSDINIRLYNVLRQHTCCTCNDDPVQTARGEHLARLLLRPPQSIMDHDDVQFDMLFSSAPFWNGSPFSRWQDLQLLVPGIQKRLPSEPIGPGRFCKLIGSAADSRICLTVQDGQLQKIGSEHLQQIVEHVPSISLADILERCYHFTAKMKLALAYILTYSAWQYYDSGWMKRRWTSETIHFVKECGRNGAGKQSELFAWKPYLSAHFGDEDLASGDFRDVDGEIHRYPRLRALGIMLVEIGIGKSLRRSDEEHPARSLAAKTNKELLLAIQYSKEEKLWGDCYYPKYLYAIDRCLDPGTFALAPCARGVDDRAKVEGLEQRKKFLYDQVVLPLEELLHGTGWMEQITAIGPLFAERRAADKCFADDAAVKPSAAREASKKSLTESQRKAKSWLWEMQHLNTELAQTFPQIGPGHFSERIRIAVLDTGCDNDAPFFHLPDNGPRLKQWKDWVDGSASWQDLHGHGTHLVSLIMRIAPEADIYVARIAESPDQLMKAGENVAEAITWASKECKADILLMAFGYTEKQQRISHAIRHALYERQDRILFFAAAANHGANDKVMFPARHDSVISIRGTNTYGKFEDFNPPRGQNEKTVLGTLGLDVPSAWLSNYDDPVYKSGTSVATAVAVGIAGVLLGYVNGQRQTRAGQDIREKLRTRQGMQAVFKALSTEMGNEHYYSGPWKLMKVSDEERWATFLVALSDIS